MIPMLCGVVYGKRNQMDVAKKCLSQTLHIYNMKIQDKPDYGLAINRALMVKFLYGEAAYQHQMDSITAAEKTRPIVELRQAMDTVSLETFIQSICSSYNQYDTD